MSETSSRQRRDEVESNGAPSMIRTCDLLVRRAKQGDRTGQREAAAPVFSNVFDHLSQPGSTPNFYRLSVICQSLFIWSNSRGSQTATFWLRIAVAWPQRRSSQPTDKRRT